MIYFIQAIDGTGPIKIGYTNDPSRRFNQIQLMSPARLKVLKVIDGDREDETLLHSYFSSDRDYGEWFRADKVLRFIDSPKSFDDLRKEVSKVTMVKRRYTPRSYLEEIAQGYNLSADELADVTGLHRNTVQSLLAAPVLPDGVKLGTLRKLARALSVSITQLLNGHPPESEANNG